MTRLVTTEKTYESLLLSIVSGILWNENFDGDRLSIGLIMPIENNAVFSFRFKTLDQKAIDRLSDK